MASHHSPRENGGTFASCAMHDDATTCMVTTVTSSLVASIKKPTIRALIASAFPRQRPYVPLSTFTHTITAMASADADQEASINKFGLFLSSDAARSAPILPLPILWQHFSADSS